MDGAALTQHGEVQGKERHPDGWRRRKNTISGPPEECAIRPNLKEGRTAESLRKIYAPAFMSATWIVLVVLSRVPVTTTFFPANCAGFFWSSS